MRKREVTLIILMLFSSLFLLSFEKSAYSNELFSEIDYPEDLDTLEEFIQSYYLLLDSDDYLKQYDFLDASLNVLENDSTGLQAFYLKLLELRSGLRDQVIVYQIGDSHVQSGYFSGTARSALQKYFGNAGRGLIFPYKLAKTNQPDDYRISSDKTFSRKDSPRSLSGYTLINKKEAKLNIKTNSFFKIDCKFNSALLYANREASLEPAKQIGVKSFARFETGEYSIHNIGFEERTNNATIVLPKNSNEVYGISLETDEPGLLYHSMGVNGAGFYTLADAIEMFKQAELLKPDLIVVSLGTNDAQGRFRESVLRKNLESFMNHLEQKLSGVPVLFTLAPDSYKSGKANPDVAKVGEIIAKYARQNDHAYWDMYKVMGGKGSIAKWKANNMAAKDHLHFSPKGYMLQGHLFYQALIKGYKKFSEQRDT